MVPRRSRRRKPPVKGREKGREKERENRETVIKWLFYVSIIHREPKKFITVFIKKSYDGKR